jgi:hypothetical protein
MRHLVLPTEKNYKKLKVSNLVFLRQTCRMKLYGGTLTNGDFVFLFISPSVVYCGYDEVEQVALFDPELIIRSDSFMSELSIEDIADIMNWEILDDIY